MRIVFDTLGGNFEACREAEKWCEERGISIGVMERDKPRGLAYEDCHISKWSNLRPHERRQMDGTMIGDMRHGPVTILLDGNEDYYPVITDE